MSSSVPRARGWALRPVLWGALVGAVIGGLLAWAIHPRLLVLDLVAGSEAALFGAGAGVTCVLLVQGLGALVPSRSLTILLGVLLVPVVLWLSGDLLYSLLVKRSYALWEASVERDSHGVRAGCEGYTIGDGSAALLLVHGFGDSPAVWQRMAPALAARGFTCDVLRLPHFATSFDEYSRCTADEWRDAVVEHLAALRKTHDRVVVVGHSMGCAVVLDALADHPDAADGVVLLAPLIEVATVRSPLLKPRTWFKIVDNLTLFTDRVGLLDWRDFHDEEALKLLKIDVFMPRAVYRQLFKLLDRNQARTPSLKVPLLMVLTENDPVIDNEAARHYFEQCETTMKGEAPMKILRELAESDHMIPMDQKWEEVVRYIDRFVEQLPEVD